MKIVSATLSRNYESNCKTMCGLHNWWLFRVLNASGTRWLHVDHSCLEVLVDRMTVRKLWKLIGIWSSLQNSPDVYLQYDERAFMGAFIPARAILL